MLTRNGRFRRPIFHCDGDRLILNIAEWVEYQIAEWVQYQALAISYYEDAGEEADLEAIGADRPT